MSARCDVAAEHHAPDVEHGVGVEPLARHERELRRAAR